MTCSRLNLNIINLCIIRLLLFRHVMDKYGGQIVVTLWDARSCTLTRAISAYLCDYISTYLVFCKLSTYIARLNVSSAHKGDSPALCFSTKKQKSRITSRGIISHQQLILKGPLPPRVSGAKHPFKTCEALILVLLKMINHLRNIFIFETMIQTWFFSPIRMHLILKHVCLFEWLATESRSDYSNK